ncbi:hypothetical protein CAPTEDRAFT_151396 [Capitella teleta]|uniref:FGFR1 oncogene partner (FOP) N-terminal dimerisation domain-containing protein n=1 Tax=Capitella teleta TaxID=283909 RepID=R7U957_CAPTE|nr:hypothetical protein CAPTEDRAFT_151396 [Capitella teleta]|eukprot:ELU00227.1 hypothetical protein CAPTEDRAFT_151396 [Capitella teleta]
MSADEETELRDLVAQTLETNGVLGKIRAQLRASVFLALEEQEKTQNQSPFVNPEVTKFLNTKDGRQMSLLVREFLEFFNLDFSLSVFDPETSAGSHYDGRENLARDFDIIESAETRKAPLLAEVLKRGSSSSSGISRLNSAENPERRSGSPCESLESHSSPRIPAPNSPLAKDSRLTREKSSDNSDSFFDEAPKYKSSISPRVSSIPVKKTQSEQSKDIKGSHGNQSSMKGSRGQDVSDADSFGKKLAELGLEVPDDDYDDDFESSNATPLGTTPRSARSDHNLKSIEDEEIQEEIDEDISVAEDLLKSDPSEVDDLTTDRTVSPTEGSTAAFDYMEDVIQHH